TTNSQKARDVARDEPLTVYCIDTSSLVNLRKWRPRSRFPDPWKRLDELIEDKRLIAPAAVMDELKEVDDALLNWSRKRKAMFRRNWKELVEYAQQILADFPGLVDPDDPTNQADPFVVALAMRESRSELYPPTVIVLTEEKYSPGKHRIPHVCQARGLKYL